MKTAKVLKEHLYRGQRRKIGTTYPVARADYRLLEKLGRIEIVPGSERSLRDQYITTSMEAEPEQPRKKRKYTRRNLTSG